MATISMSKREFDRLEVLLGVQLGRLRVADVCTLTGLSRRQVFRLLQACALTVRPVWCPSVAVGGATGRCRTRFGSLR